MWLVIGRHLSCSFFGVMKIWLQNPGELGVCDHLYRVLFPQFPHRFFQSSPPTMVVGGGKKTGMLVTGGLV